MRKLPVIGLVSDSALTEHGVASILRPDPGLVFAGRVGPADPAGTAGWDIALFDLQGRLDAVESIVRRLVGSHPDLRAPGAAQVAPAAMAIVDADDRIVFANEALCHLLGVQEKRVLGRHLGEVVEDTSAPDGTPPVVDTTRLSAIGWTECRLRATGGRRVLADHAVRHVADAGGGERVIQFLPVTDATVSRAELRFHATHDGLTKLVNRRALLERAEAVLAHAPRSGAMTGVLFIDIDGLKPVNDDYGHFAGDTVIVETAARIARCVRSGDLVARFGGDEFVVLLPGLHGFPDAERIADAVHRSMGSPIAVLGRPVGLTVSIGIALAGPGDHATTVIEHADTALYTAKRAGRACSAAYVSSAT